MITLYISYHRLLRYTKQACSVDGSNVVSVPCTLHFSLYSIHYTLYLHYTVYTIRYTLNTIQYTLYSIHEVYTPRPRTDNIKGTGIRAQDLFRWMSHSKADRILFLLDCCYAELLTEAMFREREAK